MQAFISVETEVLQLVGQGIQVCKLKGDMLAVAMKLTRQPEVRNTNPKLLHTMVDGKAGLRPWPTRKKFIHNPGMEY